MMINKAIDFSRYLISNSLNTGDTAVDATAGNGNDTIFLSTLVGATGRVYAFDIQDKAIHNTKLKLKDHSLDNVFAINDGHENMDNYVSNELGAVMFNLGYLPGGDHNIITKADSTVTALKKALKLIKKNGIISIVCYSGHRGGKEERNNLIQNLEELDQKTYQVLYYTFINQINNPPELIAIEKV